MQQLPTASKSSYGSPGSHHLPMPTPSRHAAHCVLAEAAFAGAMPSLAANCFSGGPSRLQQVSRTQKPL